MRHFSSIVGDFADTVLNWDARLPRTLWPLFARPAWLTREYFAGRRVRYVSPVRLFVTLAIVTFFVAQLMLSFGDNTFQFNDRKPGGANDTSFSQVDTVEEVVKQRDEALAETGQGAQGQRRASPAWAPASASPRNRSATAPTRASRCCSARPPRQAGFAIAVEDRNGEVGLSAGSETGTGLAGSRRR